MQQLIINLTDEEHDLLLKKAGGQNIEELTKIALDQYFARYVHNHEPLPPLDLSGRGALLKKFAEPETDPRKPQPPERREVTLEGRWRYESDADFEDAMRCYRWNLARYESEQEQKKRIKQQSLERRASNG